MATRLRLIYRTGVVRARPYICKGANAACAGLDDDMVPDGISSGGDLWLRVRREAETALARDPIFGRSLSALILDFPDLGAAVSHQIGQRLGKSAGDRHRFERVANEAFAASPDLIDAASRDLLGIVLHDPASRDLWRCRAGACRTGSGTATDAISPCCCRASRPIPFK